MTKWWNLHARAKDLAALSWDVEARAEQAAKKYGLGKDEVNAFAHIYTSALSAKKGGSGYAKLFGDWNEAGARIKDTASRLSGGARDTRHDSFKDQWNNELGRQLGRHAADNNLSDEQIAEHAAYNIRLGRAIIYEHIDGRIPEKFELPLRHLGTWQGGGDPDLMVETTPTAVFDHSHRGKVQFTPSPGSASRMNTNLLHMHDKLRGKVPTPKQKPQHGASHQPANPRRLHLTPPCAASCPAISRRSNRKTGRFRRTCCAC